MVNIYVTKVPFKNAEPPILQLIGVPLPLTKLNRSIDLYTQLFHREAFCKMFDDLKTPRTEGKKRAHARTPWLAKKVEYKPATDRLIIPYSSGICLNVSCIHDSPFITKF